MSSLLTAYLNDIANYPLLTQEEEKNLAHLIKQGSTLAVHKLVCSNLRLVVWAALRRRASHDPLFPDLVSEGNLGLMMAARRFKLDAGARFSTYALFWIQQRMHRCLERASKSVRIPHTALAKKRLAQRVMENTSNHVGSSADPVLLAEDLGISPDVFTRLINCPAWDVSLDAAIDEVSGVSLLDLLPDTACDDAESQSRRGDLEALILTVVRELPPRELEIVTRRYGLKGRRAETLEEVGRVMNISRNRVQFLQMQALRRLKTLAERRFGACLRENGFGGGSAK